MPWSGRIVLRSSETTRAARFAGAVAARHAGDPGAWLRCAVRTSGAARVLLRRARVVVDRAPAALTIAPRIQLTLATSPSRTGSDARSMHQRSASVARGLPRTVSGPSSGPMLERASRRAVRDDVQPSGPGALVRRDLSPRTTPAAGEMPAGASSAPPARVLRRRAPAVAPAPAPVRDEPVVRAAVQPPRAVPLSPVEINRLTDHIVHTIDRRIAAFRERQGRV
jgi:hypothetical protein